jgi:predicted nucleic acid-binding protein
MPALPAMSRPPSKAIASPSNRRQQFLDDLLVGMPIHPVTVPIALRAGQIDGQMQAAGTRLALADLPIGVTALELGPYVATANTRHFQMIPGLV